MSRNIGSWNCINLRVVLSDPLTQVKKEQNLPATRQSVLARSPAGKIPVGGCPAACAWMPCGRCCFRSLELKGMGRSTDRVRFEIRSWILTWDWRRSWEPESNKGQKESSGLGLVQGGKRWSIVRTARKFEGKGLEEKASYYSVRSLIKII